MKKATFECYSHHTSRKELSLQGETLPKSVRGNHLASDDAEGMKTFIESLARRYQFMPVEVVRRVNGEWAGCRSCIAKQELADWCME